MAVLNKHKNFCYRIYHIQNLKHILENGLCSKHHPAASPGFIAIGNPSIISTRDLTPVKIMGYGNIGEYIPFYFTPRSMMLFNIITGYQAPLVPKLNKEEIIVVRCLIENLSKANRFFFTDGQANVIAITNHYHSLEQLDKIDWDIIQHGDFKKSAADSDKQRRYQAEFLVHHHVSASLIESIHVYNNKAATFAQAEMAKTDKLIPIKIHPLYFFD
jgi:hypothetical protein